MNQLDGCPYGRVTFLLTDIEGSTWLWEQAPAAMDVAYQEHDAILHAVAADHGGVVFKIVGDAFQLAFCDPVRAAAAAVDAQRRLHAASWGLPRPLRVRMALHRCNAAPSADGDFRTPALNRAGRLLAASHGGQILLSADAAAGLRSLPPDLRLRDLGERRLRDLTRSEHVFQLIAADLPAQFPPIDTIDRHPSELPQPASRLIGRERELACVQAEFRSGERRLVTLTGPGGVGKSRLALEIAAGLADDFELGVYWISLAQVIEPWMIVPAIAARLGITPDGDCSLDDALLDRLREQEMLLVLDNCEHLLEPVADLAAVWLQSAPRLVLLATSRSRLRLRAELVVPVEPLALPESGCCQTLDDLMESPSGALFLERVRGGGAAPADRDAPAIAEICRMLDGLPLALELAAARDEAPDFDRLAARLTSRLAELIDGPRDLPARQRTLRGAIEWSYTRLTSEQQAVFRWISVFVGGVTLDEAARVCDLEPDDLARVLDDLVDHSLLTLVPDDPRRYTMLETVREYGRDLLAATGELADAQRKHAECYVAIAQDAGLNMLGADHVPWLGRIERRINNLRVAMHWGLSQGQAATTLAIASSLDHYWWAKGQCAEGLDWLNRAFAAEPPLSPGQRSDGLRARGSLLKAMNDHPGAQAMLVEAVALAQELGDDYRVATAELHLGELFGELGEAGESLVHLGEAVARFRRIGNPAWIRSALSSYGLTLVQEERALEALEVVAEMDRLFAIDRADDPTCRYLMRQVEINALRVLGRPVDPALADDMLELTSRIGSSFMRGGALQVSAMVALDGARVQDAAALLVEALTLQLSLDDSYAVAELLIVAARLAAGSGDGSQGARFLGAADGLTRSFGMEAIPFCGIDYAAAAVGLRTLLGEPACKSLMDEAGQLPWKSVAEDALTYVTAYQARPRPSDQRLVAFVPSTEPAAD